MSVRRGGGDEQVGELTQGHECQKAEEQAAGAHALPLQDGACLPATVSAVTSRTCRA